VLYVGRTILLQKKIKKNGEKTIRSMPISREHTELARGRKSETVDLRGRGKPRGEGVEKKRRHKTG